MNLVSQFLHNFFDCEKKPQTNLDYNREFGALGALKYKVIFLNYLVSFYNLLKRIKVIVLEVIKFDLVIVNFFVTDE